MIRVASVVVFLCALHITGCSNFKIANSHLIKAEAYRKVKTENISAVEAIYQATDKLNEAKKTDLAFYSPLHLKKAEEKISRANSLLRLRSSKRSRLSAATTAIEAIKIIEAASDNKKKVKETLADVLAQKAILDSMTIDESMVESYQAGMNKIGQLVRLVEQDKVERLSVLQPQVVSYLNRLEAKVTKASALVKTKDMLLKAKGIHAQRFAKSTYLSAVETYKKTVVYIDANYKDKAAVVSKANEAFLAASHAFFVALESQKIVQSDAATIEQYILEVQAYLTHINKQLGIDNLLNYPLKKQADLIHDAIGLKNQLQLKKMTEKTEAESILSDSADTKVESDESTISAEAPAKPEEKPQDVASSEPSAEPQESELERPKLEQKVDAAPLVKTNVENTSPESTGATEVSVSAADTRSEEKADPIKSASTDKVAPVVEKSDVTSVSTDSAISESSEPSKSEPKVIDEMKVVTKVID